MTQQGRSMVEVLAVLLIVAVLTVISVVGIQILFVKYKATQIVKAVSFAEQEIVSSLQRNRPVGTQHLDTRSFGWEEVYYEDCKDGSIDVVIPNLPESVCRAVIGILAGRKDLSFDVLARSDFSSFTGFVCRKEIDEYVEECQRAMNNDVVVTFYANQLVPNILQEEVPFCEVDDDCIEGVCCNGRCLSEEQCRQTVCSGNGLKNEEGICVCLEGYSGDSCQCHGTACGTDCCSANQTCDGTGGFYRCVNQEDASVSCGTNEFSYKGICCPVQRQGNACSYFTEGVNGECPSLDNQCNTTETCVFNKERKCSETKDCCMDCLQQESFESSLEECDACPNRFWANGRCYSCREEENIEHTSSQQCDRCLTRFFTGRNLLDGICYWRASDICSETGRVMDMTQSQCRDCRRVWGHIGGGDPEKCFNCSDNFFIWTTKADCNLCPRRFFTQGRCYFSFQAACNLSQFPSTEAQCQACGEDKRFYGSDGNCYSCRINRKIETTQEACEKCSGRVFKDGECIKK